MNEIWKDIKGYEGLYQISNLGRVKSLKTGKIRKQCYDKDRYLKIELSNKTQKSLKIHRLVAQAFIPNPLNLPQVNHKDGNKLNNNVNNLEWVSPSENTRHRIYVLNKNSLYPCKKVTCIELNKKFPSISEGARYINRKPSSLSEVLNRPNGKCGGYHWKYI